MSFSATLYNCSDDPRSLNKTLANGITVSSITPTEGCDLLSPTFILNYDKTYATCNYLVADEPFNRSYFINDIQIDIGKKIIISCSVDVLGTYKVGIEAISANVIRQENLTEPYLPDPEAKIKSGFQNYSYVFPVKAFVETPTYILNVIGGRHDEQYALLSDPTNAPPDWPTSWADYYVLDGTSYISVGIPFGFTTAPPYDVVYTTYQGVYKRLW